MAILEPLAMIAYCLAVGTGFNHNLRSWATTFAMLACLFVHSVTQLLQGCTRQTTVWLATTFLTDQEINGTR